MPFETHLQNRCINSIKSMSFFSISPSPHYCSAIEIYSKVNGYCIQCPDIMHVSLLLKLSTFIRDGLTRLNVIYAIRSINFGTFFASER